MIKEFPELNMKHEKIFSLLSEIITGICSHKDDLQIHIEQHSRVAATMFVCPHMADYRKLVGRKGVTIEALRVLAKHIGNNQGLSLVVSLQETDIGAPEPHEKIYNQAFDQNKLKRLVSELCEWVYGYPATVEIEETKTGGMDVTADVMDNVLLGHIAAVFVPYGKANGRDVNVKAK